jgi:hypothetical protein
MVACGFNTNCGDIILVYLMNIRSQIQTPRRHHKKLWNIRVKRKVFSRAFYTGRFGVFFWLNLVVVVALIMQLVPHFYPRFFGLSNKEAVRVILAFFLCKFHGLSRDRETLPLGIISGANRCPVSRYKLGGYRHSLFSAPE